MAAALDHMVKVYVSTIPGLEFICVSECDEVFAVKSKKEGRGRVSFCIAIECLPKLCKLRSVHHYWLQVHQASDFLNPDLPNEEVLAGLEKFTDELNWQPAIFGLNYFKENESKCESSTPVNAGSCDDSDSSSQVCEPANIDVPDLKFEDKNDCFERKKEEVANKKVKFIKIEHKQDFSNSELNYFPAIYVNSKYLTYLHKEPSNVKFRVTCSRTGNHKFSSTEAAKYIGSGVKGHFGWGVNLENFDIEILAFIENSEVTIAIKLSKESKHNRNVKYFGPTTLRATTSYCMLKLAGVKAGMRTKSQYETVCWIFLWEITIFSMFLYIYMFKIKCMQGQVTCILTCKTFYYTTTIIPQGEKYPDYPRDIPYRTWN